MSSTLTKTLVSVFAAGILNGGLDPKKGCVDLKVFNTAYVVYTMMILADVWSFYSGSIKKMTTITTKDVEGVVSKEYTSKEYRVHQFDIVKAYISLIPLVMPIFAAPEGESPDYAMKITGFGTLCSIGLESVLDLFDCNTKYSIASEINGDDQFTIDI